MQQSDVSAQRAREAADRAAGSRTFGRAERSKRFLRFVVEQAVSGQADRLKEYAIAVDVFDRATYDPKIDSVVRVEASKLRGLLKAYYEGEGQDEAVRIDIPKGGYVPRFVLARAGAPAPVATAGPAAVPEPLAPEPPTSRLPGPSPETAAASPGGPVRQTPAGPARRFVTGAMAFAVLVTALAGWAVRLPGSATVPSSRTTPQPLLAVLPVTAVGGPDASSPLAAQVTEDLTAALGRIGSVRLASRTSVGRYSSGTADARQIGRDLGVHAVLEGTARVDGDRLRLSVALIDARDGLRLWGEDYEQGLDAGREAARTLTDTVARHVSLMSSTQRALTRPHSLRSDAYQHYLRATYLLHANAEDLGPAIELYRAATVADPEYALAWASLSATLSLRALWGFGRAREATAEAEAAARRAMALDPSLAESHQAVGRVQVLRGDLQAAARAYERAIDLDPASIDVREDYAGWVLSRTGRLAEARAQLEHNLALDPLDWSTRIGLAQVQVRMGDLDEAQRELLALYAQEPRSPGVQIRLGNVAAMREQWPEAVAYYQGAVNSIRSSWTLGHLGWGLARVGRSGEARAIAKELGGGRFPDPQVSIAAVYAGLGERDEALAALEHAAAERTAELPGVAVDVRFRDLRAMPGFRALVARVDGPEALRVLGP